MYIVSVDFFFETFYNNKFTKQKKKRLKTVCNLVIKFLFLSARVIIIQNGKCKLSTVFEELP